MKTVRMTLNGSLVEEGDRAARDLGTTRSAFTRDALRAALTHLKERERRHRAGYERHLVQPGEFDALEDEQVWADCCKGKGARSASRILRTTHPRHSTKSVISPN